MVRRKKFSPQEYTSPHLLLQILLILPLIFITVGDALRLGIQLLGTIISITYKILRRVFVSLVSHLSSFSLPHMLRLQFPSLPKLPAFVLSKLISRRSIKKHKIISYTIYPRLVIPFAQRFQYFILGGVCIVVFLFLPYVTYYWLRTLPNPRLLTGRDIEVSTKIYDRHDTLLYEVYADQNRTPVALAQIPEVVKQATIAIEDRNFYTHPGFSIRGILRAGRELLLNNRIQGGSTITQQLIKSALLTPEVTLSRKLREIFLAFWAERLYSKNQILEMYLNQVPYGGTAWGVEAAAETYFGKSIRDLSLGEAALVAGLPAAPSEYSPHGSHPEIAFERQAQVLSRMVEDRYITREEANTALAMPIHIRQPRVGLRAPHFVMYVKSLLEERYGTRLVDRGGLRVKTSLDLPLQEKIQEIVSSHIEKLRSLNVGNGASLVTNPKTGEILAMVGSRDYFDTSRDGNVNVTTALRPPGSSIKVVTYAAALENGLTAATILDDSPITFNSPGSPPYTPVNYDGRFHGAVPLRYALGNSYNIPAVKTLARIGLPIMLEKGKQMGITTWGDEGRFGLSLTLGGGDVTMLDMAKAFGTLANSGDRVDLMSIIEVTDYTGRVLEKNVPKRAPSVVKPDVAWILGDILRDNQARSTAFGPNSLLVIPGKSVSVKTGTSNDKRDNWTIGYTPSYVTAVWVGNNNNSPMHPTLTSGVTGAAPIWHDIMTELLKEKPDELLPRPSGIVEIPCYFGRTEFFVKGTEPSSGRCAPLPTQTPSPTPP